ncbi:MAG TPA: HDIG domain-containing protein [Clostridia bacterium]|nr:HDIG domain-containing protein [Clostridia bacterium]
MQREEAVKLLKKHLKNKNLYKHCLAVEAVMRALADRFEEDAELWGIAGLLHDIDYEETKDDPHRHSIVGAEMLGELGFPEDLVYAVKVHNEAHGLPRKSLFDKALYAADPVTGLIVAGALISPEKKLGAIDLEFLSNRFKEKSFARGANREQIACCSEIGLDLNEFLELSLKAMQSIDKELGL